MTDDTFEPRDHDAAATGVTEGSASASIGGPPTVGAAPGRPSVGVVWQEGTPGHWVVRLSGLPGAPPGQDILLGRSGADSHSPFIADDFATTGHVSRIGIAWIESPAGDTSGIGRIMLQRVGAGALGKPVDPGAFASAANDNATLNAAWVADLYGAGVVGCEPAVAELATGDTLVTWIGVDGHAHGRLYAPLDGDTDWLAENRSDDPEHAAVNALLSDLGPVGAASDGARRLQAVELRPGAVAVMWLALGEGGAVLRGNLFLTPAAGEPTDDQGEWMGYPLSDIHLPQGFAGRFSAAATGEKGSVLQVSYSGPSGAATVDVPSALDNAYAEDLGGLEFDAPDPADPAAAGSPGESASAHMASDSDIVGHRQLLRDESGAQAQTSHGDSAPTPAKTALAVAASPSGTGSAPIVQPMSGGLAVAWQAADSSDGTQQIKLTLRDENGVPKGPEILVSDEAAEDVAPAVASLGDGVAAAYVDAGDGSLVVEAFAGDGAQIGEPVVDAGDMGAIVEIALGSNGKDELAVVYVRQSPNADGHTGGYGNIMLQRYAVRTEDSRSALVQLGRDGTCDGNDTAAQLTIEGDDPSASAPAVGRAPSVTGVSDGLFAITWLESDGGQETIRGSVLDHAGRQVLRIDLTGLLDGASIAVGTKPTVLDAGDGDFLVTWLQAGGNDGGYVAMSALYADTSPGTWLVPEGATRLKAFDTLPEHYLVSVLSDDGGPFLSMTWRDDSGGPYHDKVYNQRYDIDGTRLGYTTKVAEDDAPTNEQALTSDTLEFAGDTLAVSGVIDGQTVVVYTEQQSDHDLVLAAHVIDGSSPAENDQGATAGPIDVAEKTFSTGVEQETAINPLGSQIDDGLAISHINGIPITTATPVDVGAGWVQLREDGWLTVTPDAGYTGQVAFGYTVAGATASTDGDGCVVVNVEAGETPEAVTLLNQVRAVPEGMSTAADLKVADIAMADGGLKTDGLSLTGLDADMFKIVGNALYLKEGAQLDVKAKPALSIEIQASHGNDLDGAARFTLSVESASETAASEAIGDTLMFGPGYDDVGGEHQVIDLGGTGYATFQDLLASGALVQAGDDVVINLSPVDPADPHEIAVKGVDLSALSDVDFKFS